MRNHMKKSVLFLALFTLLGAFNSLPAQDKPRESEKATASGKVGSTEVSIAYGSPAVKGREIWGKLVPYGQVWRAGANEATTIEFSREVKIEGKTLSAGKYGFFVIPNEKEWTIIFNKVPNQWGAFKYDAAQDALRVNVKPKKAKAMTEKLAYTVGKNGVSLLWENLEVSIRVK